MHEIDLSRADLNLLVVFETLFEERHVGRAAGRLCLSQSATSHALGRLRDLFGDPLFVRHPRGIEPTLRARDLAPAIAAALSQIRGVLGPVAAFDPATLQRTFRLATHDYGLAAVIVPLMNVLRQEAPGVDLRCVSLPPEQVVDALDRGDLDGAIGGFHGFAAARIDRLTLFSDRFVGVARQGHPKLSAGRMVLDDFLATPQVLLSPGGRDRGEIDEALARAGLTRRVAITAPNFLSVPLIVEGSDLVGVLPERLARRLCTPFAVAMFDLPIVVEPISCSLLTLAPLADQAEMRWLKAQVLKTAGTSS